MSSPYRAHRDSADIAWAASRAYFSRPTLPQVQTATHSLRGFSAQTQPPALAASASTNPTRAITGCVAGETVNGPEPTVFGTIKVLCPKWTLRRVLQIGKQPARLH